MTHSNIRKVILFPIIVCITLILPHAADAAESKKVIPGGIPFGIKLYTEGLLVVGFSDVDCSDGSKTPAADAGIRRGDVIVGINGESICTSEAFVDAVEGCRGTIELRCKRGDTEFSVTLKPSVSNKDGKYKTGMWLRDSTAGIGTVTFIDAETGEFAGLGHGVCDSESGEVIPLMRGIIMDVDISGVKIGKAGDPGELKGHFSGPELGVVRKNTKSGVFGVYSCIPDSIDTDKLFPLGERSDVRTGGAYIISTVGGTGAAEYDIEITNLPDSASVSNFEIRVTDRELISLTGGVVQGMSGSPIIQDGKLVGAVTHVMISDPTKGYGIFIQNMLEAAG